MSKATENDTNRSVTKTILKWTVNKCSTFLFTEYTCTLPWFPDEREEKVILLSGNKSVGGNIWKENFLEDFTCERVFPFAPGVSIARAVERLKGENTKLVDFFKSWNNIRPNLFTPFDTNREGGSSFVSLLVIIFVTWDLEILGQSSFGTFWNEGKDDECWSTKHHTCLWHLWHLFSNCKLCRRAMAIIEDYRYWKSP